MKIARSYMIDDCTDFFFKASQNPMAIIGLSGEILHVNSNFSKYFDVHPGCNLKQVVDQQSLGKFEQTIKQVMSGGSDTCDFVMKVNKTDRHSITTNLYYDEPNNIILLLFTMPRKKQKKQAKELLSELDRSDNLLIITNKAGYIQEMNDMSLTFFDLPKERFIGHKIDFLLTLFSESAEDLITTKDEIIHHERVEIIHKYIHPSNDMRYYKIEKNKNQSTDFMAIKISDYTQEIRFQQELNQKESLLEVGQLAASVAHEIRNPVTTLKGFTQLLKVTADSNVMKYLTVFEEEIERIENISSELLTLSKPTEIERKPVSLKALIANIICVIEPKAIMENIKIVQRDEFQGTPFLSGDEGRLKQVFLNLLKNGLESMKSGGTLSVYLQHGGPNQVHVIIQDTGKGIEETNLKQIFMPYFTTRADGTGLGMPYVLQVVEDHEGSISVSSEVSVGTSFILTFPLIESSDLKDQNSTNKKIKK